MPKHNWETGPTEYSLFYIRKSRYMRRGYGRAVCFHCRATVNMYEDIDNVDRFHTHYDSDRVKERPGIHRPGRVRNVGNRTFGEEGNLEVCVGSDYPPIPLAYKFEDGTPIPHH